MHCHGEKYSPHSIVTTEPYKTVQTREPMLNIRCKDDVEVFSISDLSKEYLDTYFRGMNVITFPNVEYEGDNPTTIGSVIQLLAEAFQKSNKSFCVIMSGHNYYKSMSDAEIQPGDFNFSSDEHNGNAPSAEDSRNCGFVVFDLERHLVVNVRLCLQGDIKNFTSAMRLVQNDVKAALLLCNKFVGKQSLCFYGTICVPSLSTEDLLKLHDCKECNEKKIYLTKDHLKDVKSILAWWNMLADPLKNFPPDKIWFSEIPSLMMVLLAHVSDGLPALQGEPDERIRSLILTPDQVKTIHHTSKRKMIKGLYSKKASKNSFCCLDIYQLFTSFIYQYLIQVYIYFRTIRIWEVYYRTGNCQKTVKEICIKPCCNIFHQHGPVFTVTVSNGKILRSNQNGI